MNLSERLLPCPKQIDFNGQYVDRPSHLLLNGPDKSVELARSILKTLPLETLKDRLVCSRVPGEGFWLSSDDELAAPECGYILDINPEGKVCITAADPESLRYGLVTLCQLWRITEGLPICHIQDHPSLPARGIMIDLVRLKEKDHVYFDLLQQMAAWKMNVLFMHFTDNQGCTVELKSHPELVSAHAMPQEVLKDLIQTAEELGIRVIPEVEPWGHARWITDVYPQFAEPDCNSICLASDMDALFSILDDVIGELSSLFPDPIFHIGCDEADYYKHDACKQLSDAMGQDAMIAAHINRVNQTARKYGKTSMIWADVVLRYDGILGYLDSDIITEDWDYAFPLEEKNMRKLKDAGFDTWGAPSLMYGSWRICPSMHHFNNTRNYAAIADRLGLSGIATTIWLPQRYIPRTIDYGIAWAAQESWNPDTVSIRDTTRSFIRHHFGMEPDAGTVEDIIALATVGQKNPLLAFIPNDETLAKHLQDDIIQANEEYARITDSLAVRLLSSKAGLSLNTKTWDSLILAARLGEHIAQRRLTAQTVAARLSEANDWLKENENEHATSALLESARLLVRLESARAEIWEEMQKNWDIDRYEDDPFRTGDGNTNSLYWWFGSPEAYGYCIELTERLKALAEIPDRTAIAAILGQIADDSELSSDDPYVE